jgi:molybdenum cofactor cytidylyltransferase
MSHVDIVGIILAAGASKRFGSAKQLLPFGDTTLLGQAVQNANASNLERVVVVMGRMADEVQQSIDFDLATTVDNTSSGTGCASSLLAGLDAAADCAAIMLLLGDQPGVKAVWKLIEAYPERVLQVNIDAELPPDVDTPADYERVLTDLGY